MSVSKQSWFLLLGLVVVVGLPLLERWSRRPPSASACALDGVQIAPIYRVEVVDNRGATHAFCCLRCAEIWLEHQSALPREVRVTDEESGQPVAAAAAWYVRSSVVTVPTTGNRVHVFRNRADAERHAETFAGTVLPEAKQPLRRWTTAPGDQRE
jgi:hypothetical protein